MGIKKPDFFIVGAPKCGTTALHEYLREHPEIYMSEAKELHHFGSDLAAAPFVRDREGYLSHFRDWRDEKRGGESSVFYLFSGKAAEEIKAFNPSASIIIMLREPVEMLHSYHSQLLYTWDEEILDFEEALEAEEERRNGRRNSVRGVPPEALQYRAVARFAGQVERYLKVFGPDRVHVILYDDLKADTAGVYQDTLRFLEVRADFRPEFKVANANKRIRWRSIQGLLLDPPPALLRAGKLALPEPLRKRVLKVLHGLNTSRSPRESVPPALSRRLREEFAPDIERLGKLIGRDLGHWTRESNEH